jgi:hypothetical protein
MTFLTRATPAAQGRASAQVVGERSAHDPTADPSPLPSPRRDGGARANNRAGPRSDPRAPVRAAGPLSLAEQRGSPPPPTPGRAARIPAAGPPSWPSTAAPHGVLPRRHSCRRSSPAEQRGPPPPVPTPGRAPRIPAAGPLSWPSPTDRRRRSPVLTEPRGSPPRVPTPGQAPRIPAAGPLSSPGEERDRERSPGSYDPDSAYSLSLAAFTYPKAPSLPPPLATYFCR